VGDASEKKSKRRPGKFVDGAIRARGFSAIGSWRASAIASVGLAFISRCPDENRGDEPKKRLKAPRNRPKLFAKGAVADSEATSKWVDTGLFRTGEKPRPSTANGQHPAEREFSAHQLLNGWAGPMRSDDLEAGKAANGQGGGAMGLHRPKFSAPAQSRRLAANQQWKTRLSASLKGDALNSIREPDRDVSK